MSDVNQYAISQVLGSTMTQIGRTRFGSFGLMQLTGDSIRCRLQSLRQEMAARTAAGFTYDQDAIVVRAFEETRQGWATDALLWDVDLARAFAERSGTLGLAAPLPLLVRRLINVRKNIARYRQHGITIQPATRKEPRYGIVGMHAHAIEFVLVKLRYLYGVSIDDILMDGVLGGVFEEQAGRLAPTLNPTELRLGALYIRKNRNFPRDRQVALASLDIGLFEGQLTAPLTLPDIDPAQLPESPGILEVKEHNRYLYISRNERLREAVEQFRTGEVFEAVANEFWTPKRDEITIRFVQGSSVLGVGTGSWELRLIHDLSPVFNWPLRSAA